MEITLNIALSGYGRMGREVEAVALSRGHNIVCRIDREEEWETLRGELEKADMVIDFSSPQAAVANIGRCFSLRLPLVIGTTGWDADRAEVEARCHKENQSLFWASNFSIGVYLFMATAACLASRMEKRTDYKAHIEEIHHIHKLDKPSGTALVLAKEVAEAAPRLAGLPIESFREGEVVGVHRLCFDSEDDGIMLCHEAKSRRGFALGAVCAAEWLHGRRGFFGMRDMMGF